MSQGGVRAHQTAPPVPTAGTYVGSNMTAGPRELHGSYGRNDQSLSRRWHTRVTPRSGPRTQIERDAKGRCRGPRSPVGAWVSRRDTGRGRARDGCAAPGTPPSVWQRAARAEFDDDKWVINRENGSPPKPTRRSSSSSASEPVPIRRTPNRRKLTFIVPRDLPAQRTSTAYGERADSHAHVRITDVRLAAEYMDGGRSDTVVVAQVRLGGWRLRDNVRAGRLRKTKGEQLSRNPARAGDERDIWVGLGQFRLLSLGAA